MRTILLLLFTTFLLTGREISLEEINSYPKSVAKDFYIWQFLKQPWVSKENAETVYKQVHKVTRKIRKALKKRGGVEQIKFKSCKILSIQAILKHNSIDCVKQNLTPKRVSLLDGDDVSKLITKFKNIDKDLSLLLMAIYFSQDIEKTLYSNPEIYLNIFLYGGSKIQRGKKINKELSKDFLQKLVKYPKKFEKFVLNVLAYGDRFSKIKKALLTVEPSNKMTTKTLFALAFNFIKSGQDGKSIKFFRLAKKNGWYQIHRDMATFWLYLTTKNQKHLKILLTSWDINIYTIYAREQLGNPVASNIIHQDKLYTYNSIFMPQIDPTSPFDWIKTKREISKYQKDDKSGNKLLNFANLFKTEKHIGTYFYIMERGYKFKRQSFPTPYKDYLKNKTISERALIYSIARQESKFIPSAISTSYALGMMQIMPFLIEDIAKRKGEKIELEEMFNPIKSLEYSLFHMKTLRKEFISPLFIAYAYNGGGGFTRRMLKSGLFSKGDYEPFLSMETLSYHETRKYGKKVLANYIVYRRLLGDPITLHELLSDLTVPSKSDFIRKR